MVVQSAFPNIFKIAPPQNGCFSACQRFENFLSKTIRKYTSVRQSILYFETEYLEDLLIFGVLTPLSTIFQLYHGDQF